MGKGDRNERELIHMLEDAGFGTMRAGASGGGTPLERPDVLAANGRVCVAIEAKSSNGRPIYIDEEEVEDLLRFCDRFGAEPWIGVRFDREDWYFFHLEDDDVYRTDSGNYRIKKEKALAEGTDFEGLIGESEQVRLNEMLTDTRS